MKERKGSKKKRKWDGACTPGEELKERRYYHTRGGLALKYTEIQGGLGGYQKTVQWPVWGRQDRASLAWMVFTTALHAPA